MSHSLHSDKHHSVSLLEVIYLKAFRRSVVIIFTCFSPQLDIIHVPLCFCFQHQPLFSVYLIRSWEWAPIVQRGDPVTKVGSWDIGFYYCKKKFCFCQTCHMLISTQKKTLHLIHTWRKQSLDIQSVVKVVSFSKNKHECSFHYLPPISVPQPSIKIQQMYTEI